MATKPSKKPTLDADLVMALEEDTRQNTTDIKALTGQVVRLATMMENSEKRHDNDMDDVKELTAGINKLTERINAVVSIERDIATIKDTISDKTGDIRALRHDLNNMAQGLAGVTILNEKVVELGKTVAEQGVEISALKTWRSEAKGAGSAIKGIGSAIWGMFGTGIGALFIYIIHSYFTKP